jgi:hypothetical protein
MFVVFSRQKTLYIAEIPNEIAMELSILVNFIDITHNVRVSPVRQHTGLR